MLHQKERFIARTLLSIFYSSIAKHEKKSCQKGNWDFELCSALENTVPNNKYAQGTDTASGLHMINMRSTTVVLFMMITRNSSKVIHLHSTGLVSSNGYNCPASYTPNLLITDANRDNKQRKNWSFSSPILLKMAH